MGAQGRKYYEQNFMRSVLFANLQSWMKEAVLSK